jgi:group I intron endonuclease
VFVYMIKNKVNGKAYIGMTKEKVQTRFKRHLGRDKHSRCYALQAAFAKYGNENFSIETLYEGDSYSEIKMVEKGLIAQYGTMTPNGYNLTAGGDGACGYKHSPERVAQMIARNKIKLLGNQNAKGHKGSTHSAKLTNKEVHYIKLSLLTGMAVRELAKQFNVDRNTIVSIRDNKTWKHAKLNIVSEGASCE